MVTVPSFDRVNWSSETERKPEIQSSTMGNYFEETRTVAEQPPRNMPINTALNEYCGIESTAYALAVIRPDGSIATFMSDEVKTDPKYLFTPAFKNEFLVASGHAPLYPEIGDSIFKRECDAQMACVEVDYRTARYNVREFGGSSYRKRTPPRSHNAYDDDSSDSSMSPGSRKRLRATGTRSRDRAIPTLPTRTISIGDDAARDDVYRQCLKDMQQNGCKVLGKAWVKLLEPKKQSTYPYTKGASKRPPWWPAMTGPNKIRHKEPDHLHKRERIILLMHILGLVVNQDSKSQARLRGVTVAKLEEVTREAMATWFADREKPKNAEKRGFLTQLFRVLYNEERYRRGELDGSATVSVNDGAGTTDDDDDDEDSDPSPQHREAHTISPFLPTPSSSLSPSHPISSTAAAEMQDYYPPRLPLRSTYIPTTPDTTTGDDYADAPYPIHHHNGLTHNPHPQQPPSYPTRAWPAQEINIYTGGSPWPTPPAAASGPMQHYPFGMSTSSPPQQGSFGMPTATSSPPQQQGQGAVFLPPPMAPAYEDVNGARGSFDGGWEVI
ncbi:hypothetical protein VE01_09686 [Pseudogymnoascus verrucosus]|uniref:Subtelomeric hrmA-associated cluster protein AFUB-079030/YDR124W-like helical bundle domain-containing protein n=1 Tax=Pseudogymnoascus verrucosus TaxID=342668 RepID=A0A1B8GA22_9PEZI|nr:uncharacterized protein VE01_09686 [Pseudogymnoascus verrucosus]OBT92686.1 hypothetical protein VE01_09686 [Pseudogymnoascus verrucosus]